MGRDANSLMANKDFRNYNFGIRDGTFSKIVTKVVTTTAKCEMRKETKSFCKSESERECESERSCFFLLNRDNAPFMCCTIIIWVIVLCA